MEAMLGICLYSYPYLKLAKMPCFSYYCFCLFFNKIEEEGTQNMKAFDVPTPEDVIQKP
jgi:hypothetical protein